MTVPNPADVGNDLERLRRIEALARRPGTPGEGIAARAAADRLRRRLGLPLVLTRPRACRCGCTQFLLEPGKGPHAAHLRCQDCNRGGVWLSRQQARNHAANFE